MDNYALYCWYMGNIDLLRKTFGACVDHAREFSWIKIKQFPLPPNWQQFYTGLLIVLPGLRGSIYATPDQFYLDLGLRTIWGEEPDHIYGEGNIYNDLANHKYARYSVHLKRWFPSSDILSGDNLLTVTNIIYVSLEMLADGQEVL